jgi:hypothetical protein
VTRRSRTILIAALALLALLVAATVPSLLARRTVTVKTGEVVLCTAGEIVEDNTRDVDVPASQVSKYSVTTRVITCPAHRDSSGLYEEAQKAIAGGDLEVAAEKLKLVLVADPTNTTASAQLKAIEAGKKPRPDEGSGQSSPATSGPTPDEPIDAVSNLAKYVPDDITGFSAQGVVADPASITRNYLPSSGAADLMVVTAEQTVDAKSAASTIETMKGTYPTSADEITLKSGARVYFGVWAQYAVILVAEGPIVVAVEIHAKSGNGLKLKDALIAVANRVMGE